MVKKIHYCWFGGKELPKSVKKCISTWKKILPDYEIKEWNEKNFDINVSPFVKEAYENKKWAFVSDYVRIYALYQEGGIYFDTDMKVIKNISHIVDRDSDIFFGYEDSGYLGTAVIGVKEKHNKYIKEILDYYNNLEHFNSEIMYNYANPVIITKIVKKYESHINEQGIHIFDNNIYVYPRDYFYPLSYNYSEKVYTENTCMVHLFNATWTDRGERRVIGVYRKFGPELGKIINSMIDGVFNIKNSIFETGKRFYKFLRIKYSIHFNISKRIKKLTNKLQEFKENYIVICHPEMLENNEHIGEMFNNNIIELREMHTRKEAKKVANAINESGKRTVIFNSYANGWENVMSELKYLKRDINIKVLIHGGEALFAETNEWQKMDTIVDLYNKGNINELGFFKKSLFEYYSKKGFNAKHLMKYIEIRRNNDEIKEKNNKELIEIGMYEAYDNTLKNIHNQLSAISLLENSKLNYFPINYKVSMKARKYSVNLADTSIPTSKQELYNKMAKNDINLFISLAYKSELLPIESLEMDTIVLVGSNYEYFDGSELEKYIMVNKEDNIIEIYNKIKFALDNREKILKLYRIWRDNYIKDAKESIDNFVKI